MGLKTIVGFLLLANIMAEISKKPSKMGPTPRLNSWGRVGTKTFFGGDEIVNWDDANWECREFGMKMVRFDTPAEKDFVLQQMFSDPSKGPVWLGARTSGKYDDPDIYVWSDDYSITNSSSPPVGDSVGFYYYVEQGKMGLVLAPAIIGSQAFGVHSHTAFAKALCQLVA